MDEPTAVNDQKYTIGDAPAQAAPGTPAPAAGQPGQYTIGDAPSSQPQPQESQAALEQRQRTDPFAGMEGGALRDVPGTSVATGAVKGAMSTVLDVDNLVRKGFNKLGGHYALTDKPEELAPQGTGQMIGYGGESLLEFLMGDDAIKALSFAEKLSKSAKIAKLLETSPRLMKAVKMGASAGKLVEELSPEERKIVEASPVLSRLMGTALNSTRAGVVQAGQTFVKSGGDVGESVKAGAEMTAGSAVLGAPFDIAGGLLSKGGKAAGTIQQMTEAAGESQEARQGATEGLQKAADTAANAPEKDEIAANVSDTLNSAHKEMGARYAAGLENSVQKPLQSMKVPLEGSPVQKAAQDVLGLAENSDEWMKVAKETTPVSAEAKTYIEKVAKAFQEDAEAASEEASSSGLVDASGKAIPSSGTPEVRPPYLMDINMLTKQRQVLMERTRDARASGKWSDARAYSMVIDGIDNTIGKMAQDSGNPKLLESYEAVRKDYRETKALFEDRDARSAIQDLMRGNLDDVKPKLLNGQHSGHIIDVVRQLADRETAQGGAVPGEFKRLGANITADLVREGPEKLLSYTPAKVDNIRSLVGQEGMDQLSDLATMHIARDGAEKLFTYAPTKLENLGKLVGEDKLRDLGGQAFNRLVEEATAKGHFDAGEVITKWNEIAKKNPAAMQKLFSNAMSKETVDATVEAIQQSADAQKMLRVLGYTGTGSLAAGLQGGVLSFLAGPIGLLLGASMTGTEALAGKNVLKQFVQWYATHPQLWGAIRKVDQAANSPISSGLNRAAQIGAGKAAVYGGTANSLAGP